MKYPKLFSPLQIGIHSLRNRIAHTATVSGYGANTKPTQRLIDYHHARAKGGTAMIVTELMPVHETSLANPFLISVFQEQNLDLFKQWAESVEAENCRLVGQLGHVGRQQLWSPLATPISASNLPDPLSWTVPHKMTLDEIQQMVASFVAAAERLQRAGFSGIELHGAHGYLLTQFMSPFSNDREDRYGGDRKSRLLFVEEIIAGIRQRCGDSFLMGLKMPCDEGVVGGIDPNEAEELVKVLVSAGGLDYFAFSQGNFSPSLENHLPDMHFTERPYLHLHARMRKSAGSIPVMTLGRIESPSAAEQALQEGCGDFIGFSRALVSDAGWANKAKVGAEEQIRPCIYCNYCWGEIHAGRGMTCVHNPQLATPQETTWTPKKISSKKRIIVVGGGPAGLEAAWIAAKRGHKVELFNSSERLGGGALWESRLPGRKDIERSINYQVRLAREAGVVFNLGSCLGGREVISLDPDEVILAEGATLTWPAALESNAIASDIKASTKALLDIQKSVDGTAILFDQDHSAACYAAAELFARHFNRTIIITPRPTIGSKVNYISLIGVFRRLAQLRVEIIPLSMPISANKGTVAYRNVLNGDTSSIGDVALFSYATPRSARNDLLKTLEATDISITKIGDCKAPRNLAAAIHEGNEVGMRC